MVSFDTADPANVNRIAAFRNHYRISIAVNIVGGYSGSLNNSYGRIALERPDGGNAFVLSDEVIYDDAANWPSADGTGSTLTRTAANSFGNAPTSWTAQTPTPGVSSFSTVDAPQVIAVQRDGDVHVRPDLLGELEFLSLIHI